MFKHESQRASSSDANFSGKLGIGVAPKRYAGRARAALPALPVVVVFIFLLRLVPRMHANF